MAFPLFPKSHGKDKSAGARRKPALTPQHDARATKTRTPASAREIADVAKARPGAPAKPRPPAEPGDSLDRDISVTGPPSFVDLSPSGQSSILVVEANPGLCAVLEDAALRYANGQAAPARQALEQGLASDDEARQSPLAWLALFDLLQREGDRAAFDQLALQYIVAFERSAPSWEEREPKPAPAPRPTPGAYFALTGKLSSASATPIANMLAATGKQPQVRLDLGSLTGADDVGARLLADALIRLRKRRYALVLQHPEKIRQALENAARQGREAGEGYWVLLLELLQWQNDHKNFEDRALEFAIAFEVSPPSWEPPPIALGEPAVAAGTQPAATERANVLVWEGTMIGPADAQLAKFAEFREGRSILPIDMSGVDRIDFVCAGHMLNAISRAENQRKTVQIVGASPIIRALLLLMGISSRHFIKKSQ